MNIHIIIKSESLAQIRTIVAEIQSFSGGLFFIGASCNWWLDVKKRQLCVNAKLLI